jgi:hypothetical protein
MEEYNKIATVRAAEVRYNRGNKVVANTTKTP